MPVNDGYDDGCHPLTNKATIEWESRKRDLVREKGGKKDDLGF